MDNKAQARDYEGLQVVARMSSSWSMPQVVQRFSNHWGHHHYGHQSGGDKSSQTPTTATVSPDVGSPSGFHHQHQFAGATPFQPGPPAGLASGFFAEPAGEKKIFGVRWTTLLLCVSNVVLLIVLIVVSAVLGTRLSNHNSSAQLCPFTGSNSSSSDNPGTNASAASPSTTGTSNPQICFSTTTAPLSPGDLLSVDCPLAASAPPYVVPGTRVSFARSCGVDHGGNDMGRFPVGSMADCMALCAQLALYPTSVLGPCKGVTWVYGDGKQGENVSYCYPKSDMGGGGTPRNGTESAVLSM